MRLLLHPLYLVSFFLAAANQVSEKVYGYFVPIAHAYLDDLLCMPLILAPMLVFFRKVYYRNSNYIFPPHLVAMAVVYCSLFFELLLPELSGNYVRDWVDVLCYATGAVAFYIVLNKEQKQSAVNYQANV